MKGTAFDIETIPNMDMVGQIASVQDRMVGVKAPANYKDPQKIDEYVASKRREASDKREVEIQKMNLNPFTGRICAAAFVGGDWQDSVHMAKVDDDDERQVIQDITKTLNLLFKDDLPLVTFNGIYFDLPYLYKRCIILDLPVPDLRIPALTKRYSYYPHFDIRMALTDWDRHGAGSLDYFAKAILGESKEEPEYSKFISLIEAGKGAEIADSCLQHTRLTRKLFERMQRFYLDDSETHIKNGRFPY